MNPGVVPAPSEVSCVPDVQVLNFTGHIFAFSRHVRLQFPAIFGPCRSGPYGRGDKTDERTLS